MSEISRRTFVKQGAAATVGVATALSQSKVAGANERIRLGVIGAANRGGQMIEAARKHEAAEFVAICDVHTPTREKWAGEFGAKAYLDYRDLLDRNDIDAVIVATPDHWHALQCVDACKAGKDVYVEKPLSMTVVEGQKMVEAARSEGRIVQTGMQRRSSKAMNDLRDLIRSGGIGKVTLARAYRLSNMYPNGIGRAKDSDPPADLDWDLWLGPREKRPYRENIAPYKFRWWQSYSSQLGNWGVHYFDLLRWLLDEEAPASVSAHGGQFAVDDDRTIPDTLEAIFEFSSGRLMTFGQHEASGNPMFPSGEVELRGTDATIYAHQFGYKVVPERGGQFADSAPRTEAREVREERQDLNALHIGNFFDSVKSRKRPNADVEEGRLSAVFSQLGNISLATKSRIEWDSEKARITNNEAANDLLHYEYRAPWTLG